MEKVKHIRGRCACDHLDHAESILEHWEINLDKHYESKHRKVMQKFRSEIEELKDRMAKTFNKFPTHPDQSPTDKWDEKTDDEINDDSMSLVSEESVDTKPTRRRRRTT